MSLHWALIIAKTAALLANLSTVVNAIVLGAHLLGYPDAFNMTTGPLHWELLRTESKVSSFILLLDQNLIFVEGKS